MRYAIIRGGEGLPPPDVQRQGLNGIPYDLAFEEGAATRKGQDWLFSHLQQLKGGDEVLLWDLDVLQLSTAELLTLLLRLFEGGVTVRLTKGARPETLNLADGAPRTMRLLAEHEARRPSRPPPTRRGRSSRRPLSPYQVKYARQLLLRGTSRRAVGLLFQLAPDELSEQLAGSDDSSLDAGTS